MNRTTPVSVARCSTPCSRHWFSFSPPWQGWSTIAAARVLVMAALVYLQKGCCCTAGDKTLVWGEFATRSPSGVRIPAGSCAHHCGSISLKLPCSQCSQFRAGGNAGGLCCSIEGRTAAVGQGNSILWQTLCSQTLLQQPWWSPGASREGGWSSRVSLFCFYFGV